MIDTQQVDKEVKEMITRVIKDFERSKKELRNSQTRKANLFQKEGEQGVFELTYKGVEMGSITVHSNPLLFKLEFTPAIDRLSPIITIITPDN